MGGKIEVDGVDISKLDMAELRNQITMIPQDPIMFTGTLRYNLDPFEESSNERITQLIKKAGLEYLLEGVSKKELKEISKKQSQTESEGKGLEFKVQEEGKNLSVGERQLICIIRAILRCNKIVILDEATANIDVITERAIQRLIDEEFKGATVLCIAHRLNTIIRSDMVLVMDKGKVAEYDSPNSLMADPSSIFSQMLKEKKRTNTDDEQYSQE